MDDELRSLGLKALESFEALKKLLAGRGECEGDRVVIYDDPIVIEITPREIVFLIDDEVHGVISRDRFYLSDEVRFEAESWLRGLTSLKFKRYVLKSKKSD